MWFQHYFTSLTSTPTRRRQIRRSAVATGRLKPWKTAACSAFSPVAGFPVGGADPKPCRRPTLARSVRIPTTTTILASSSAFVRKSPW